MKTQTVIKAFRLSKLLAQRLKQSAKRLRISEAALIRLLINQHDNK